MKQILFLILYLLSFDLNAQKQVQLDFKPFKSKLEYHDFKSDPKVLDYELIVKKTIIEEKSASKSEYFIPFEKSLSNPYFETVALNKYENEVIPLKFIKKRIENTEIKNNAPNLIFKDNAASNIKYSDKAHGFFSNSIFSIAQTNDKQMWFSSGNDGLCKYNGNVMEILTTASGLPSNYLRPIFKDSQNRLWVGTSSGFCYIKDNYIYLPSKQINESILSITERKNNEIWIGTLSNGVYRYVNDSLYHINKQFITGSQVEALLGDTEGNVWIGTDNYSLTKFDGKTFTKYKFYPNENEDACLKIHENKLGLWFGYFGKPLIHLQNGVFTEFYYNTSTTSRIFGMTENSQGLWIADYEGGIYLINLKNREVKSYAKNKSVGKTAIFTLHTDNNDNIWAGSLATGIYRIDKSFFLLNKTPSSLSYSSILNIIYNKQDIWYLPDGGRLLKMNSHKNTTFYHKSIPLIGSAIYIYDAEIISENTAWLAAYGQGPTFMNEKNFYYYRFEEGKYVIDLSSFDKKEIWYATQNKGLIQYKDSTFYLLDKNIGLSENQLVCIIHTAPKEVWLGTENTGINIIKKNKIAFFDKKQGLTGNQINYLYTDHKKRVWVATMNGLNIIDGNKIATITTKDGILSNVIRSIKQDIQGNFWIASTSGLTKLEPNGELNFSISNFDISWGQYLNGFGAAVASLPNGKMLWKNNLGIVDYNPPSNSKIKTIQKPIIHFNNIYLGKKKIDVLTIDERLEIKPSQNLKMDFTAIDWGTEINIRYKYSLLKKNKQSKEWIDLGKAHSINLNEIPYGEYTLHIAAENNFKQDVKKINLVFLPPWWQTWWANALWTLIFVGVIALFFLWRIKILEKQKQKLETQVKERTSEIVKQKENIEEKNKELSKLDKFKQSTISMLVHDLKNPLNLILNTSIDKKIKQASYSMLNLVMNILDINKEKTTNKEIELKACNLIKIIEEAIQRTEFLCQQKNIQIQTDYKHSNLIKANTDFSVRIFENLLTNAIKYSYNNSVIYLNTFVEENLVKVEVKDQGKGIDEKLLETLFDEYVQDKAKKSGMVASTGLGLAFCKMAVEKQNGNISVKSLLNKGSSFFVSFQAGERVVVENKSKIKKNSKLELSEDDKKFLNKIVTALSQTEIYRITTIINLIKPIENQTESIKFWCENIKKSCLTANIELYKKLINDAL